MLASIYERTTQAVGCSDANLTILTTNNKTCMHSYFQNGM